MIIKEIFNQVNKQTSSMRETMELVCFALNITKEEYILKMYDSISKSQEEEILKLAKRLNDGEPLEYILGIAECGNSNFFVGKGVLIPREDTLCVIKQAIYEALKMKKKKLKVIDLCAGSGVIAINFKKAFENGEFLGDYFPVLEIDMSAVELSKDAFCYLEKNVQANKSAIKTIRNDKK